MVETVVTVPRPLSSFIGREAEVADVIATLHSGARLLTLTGPGGVGKTRVAIEVARAFGSQLADGAVFVELASVGDPTIVPVTVAQAMGIRDGQGAITQRISGYLAGKQILVVLDNFEHVLNAVDIVTQVLQAGAGVSVLVTSRTPLRLSGEQVIQLAPLSLDERSADGDAVQLFLARARAVRSDFRASADTLDAVVSICDRVDRLPLAIELAAARIRTMTAESLRDRLIRRLPLLADGARDQPARQQSMAGAIAWSYELLDLHAQRLFRRLGVFAGGFDDDAVRAVAPHTDRKDRNGRTDRSERHDRDNRHDRDDRVLDTLASLVDASLVNLTADGRFTMLETIREYAVARLDESGESEAIRLLHAEHYGDVARNGDAALRGHEQHEWLDRLEREHDNFRSALRWSCDRGLGDAAARLAGSLQWFWVLHSHFSEGRRWLEAAIALRPSPANEVTVLLGAGLLSYNQADYDTALTLLHQCVELGTTIGSLSDVSRAQQFLAVLAYRQGRYEDAHEHASRSLDLARAADDEWAAAGALCVLGFEVPGTDEHEATRLLEEAEAISRRLGDSWGVARAANTLGEYARGRQDWAAATRLYELALDRYRLLGSENGAALVMYNLGCVAQQSRDSLSAARWLADALKIHAEREDQRGVAHCLAGVAGALAYLGDLEIAARLLGTAERMFEITNTTRDPVDQVLYDADVAHLRRALADDVFRAAWHGGRLSAFDESVREALAVARRHTEDAQSGVPAGSVPSRQLRPREREVLRLLAEGATDGQIAEALAVSTRTAARAVETLKAKLGAESRAAIAAHALRDGLIT